MACGCVNWVVNDRSSESDCSVSKGVFRRIRARFGKMLPTNALSMGVESGVGPSGGVNNAAIPRGVANSSGLHRSIS